MRRIPAVALHVLPPVFSGRSRPAASAAPPPDRRRIHMQATPQEAIPAAATRLRPSKVMIERIHSEGTPGTAFYEGRTGSADDRPRRVDTGTFRAASRPSCFGQGRHDERRGLGNTTLLEIPGPRPGFRPPARRARASPRPVRRRTAGDGLSIPPQTGPSASRARTSCEWQRS